MKCISFDVSQIAPARQCESNCESARSRHVSVDDESPWTRRRWTSDDKTTPGSEHEKGDKSPGASGR